MNRKDKHRPMWARVERRIHEQVGLPVDDTPPRAVVMPFGSSWESARPVSTSDWATWGTNVITFSSNGASWTFPGVRPGGPKPVEAATPRSRYPTNRR